MAQAEIRETLSVDKDKFFKTITDYANYPKFVDGCTQARVLEQKSPDGEARVQYAVSLIKDVTYTLDHKVDAAAGVMHWSLVESEFMKVNNGRWELRSAGPGKTDVSYKVEIEFKIPVPGLILNRLIKSNLPAMLKQFEKQAQKL